MLTFRQPLTEDVESVIARMRRADRAECLAAGHDPGEAMRRGVKDSAACLAAVVDGRAEAIFGLAPIGGLLSTLGAPWMLGTDEVPRHRRALIEHTPRYIRAMLAITPRLMNYVHAENTTAVAWLRRAGFEMGPVAPHPRTGAPFRLFEMKGGTAHL